VASISSVLDLILVGVTEFFFNGVYAYFIGFSKLQELFSSFEFFAD